MYKIKLQVIVILSALLCVLTVFASTSSYTSSTFNYVYSDYPTTYHASSQAGVISGAKIAACIGVRDAGGQCGNWVTNGNISYKKLQFASSSYNYHVHWIKNVK